MKITMDNKNSKSVILSFRMKILKTKLKKTEMNLKGIS